MNDVRAEFAETFCRQELNFQSETIFAHPEGEGEGVDVILKHIYANSLVENSLFWTCELDNFTLYSLMFIKRALFHLYNMPLCILKLSQMMKNNVNI